MASLLSGDSMIQFEQHLRSTYFQYQGSQVSHDLFENLLKFSSHETMWNQFLNIRAELPPATLNGRSKNLAIVETMANTLYSNRTSTTKAILINVIKSVLGLFISGIPSFADPTIEITESYVDTLPNITPENRMLLKTFLPLFDIYNSLIQAEQLSCSDFGDNNRCQALLTGQILHKVYLVYFVFFLLKNLVILKTQNTAFDTAGYSAALTTALVQGSSATSTETIDISREKNLLSIIEGMSLPSESLQFSNGSIDHVSTTALQQELFAEQNKLYSLEQKMTNVEARNRKVRGQLFIQSAVLTLFLAGVIAFLYFKIDGMTLDDKGTILMVVSTVVIIVYAIMQIMELMAFRRSARD